MWRSPRERARKASAAWPIRLNSRSSATPLCFTCSHYENTVIRHRFSSAEKAHREAGPAHHRVARLLGGAHQVRQVDADQFATPLPRLAGDEDGIDIAGIHEVHHRAVGIVERPQA